MQKILVIGAVPHPDDLKTYGGTTTLMRNFIEFLDERHYNYLHIDTLRYKNRLLNMAYFGAKFLWGLLRCRVVMYNVSYNGAFTMFYHTAPIAYALRRKVVFRKFGGNFLNQLRECPAEKRLRMTKLLNRASLIYFETKILMNAAPKLFQRSERVHWFPNCRKPSAFAADSDFQKRFVFISRVEEVKGIDHLLNVANRLPADYTVHVYGPIIDPKYGDENYFKGTRAEYRGALKTEGYPGIITEAMSVGLPVIATRIGGIPEMVENGINGILTEPHDEEGLLAAILSIDKNNYKTMSQSARKLFDERYNSDVVNARVYEEILSIH